MEENNQNSSVDRILTVSLMNRNFGFFEQGTRLSGKFPSFEPESIVATLDFITPGYKGVLFRDYDCEHDVSINIGNIIDEFCKANNLSYFHEIKDKHEPLDLDYDLFGAQKKIEKKRPNNTGYKNIVNLVKH